MIKNQKGFLKLFAIGTMGLIFSILLFDGITYFLIQKKFSPQIQPEKVADILAIKDSASPTIQKKETVIVPETLLNFPSKTMEEYLGPVRHIFFHSLIIYPEKALSDIGNSNGYKDNMITVSQFKQILQQLYEQNFILIDGKILYSFDESGIMHKNKIYLPKEKKPLILSIDDLSYYAYMKNGGFATKLVLENNTVKTEVRTPQGDTIITDDGDIVPILDSFVKEHPDFSLNGAKGIIGLTGYQGILGYRTQILGEQGDLERKRVLPIVEALKKSGWVFASHSFGHDQYYRKGTITSTLLARDIARWSDQVKPLVGETNIFIGPFGQIFSEQDPRRQQLIDAGFTVLYGVGTDNYLKFFDTHIAMNRFNIDGYRLTHNPEKLNDLFGISVDPNF